MAVEPYYIENELEKALLSTIPTNSEIHRVPAVHYRWTRKFGLGSLALRSFFWYWKHGNGLLNTGTIDLVYFSTTEFPLLILGAYWKRKFGVPYIIDMQDPWLNEYYFNRPKSERPPKYWFSSRLDKFLEPIAMNKVDGIISVSQNYCTSLSQRYQNVHSVEKRVIPFGGAEKDFEYLKKLSIKNTVFDSTDRYSHIVYVGRGGHDMGSAVSILFSAFVLGLEEQTDLFENVRMHFIGTDYAPRGRGTKTIEPHARSYGIAKYVSEVTDRVPYFTTLQLLTDANILLLLGSDDSAYTASKLYPYILARRPLLAISHEESSVVDIIERTRAGIVIPFSSSQIGANSPQRHSPVEEVYRSLAQILRQLPFEPDTDWEAFKPYTSEEMTRRQVQVFDTVVSANQSNQVDPH